MVGPQLVGPSISGVVCVAVAMAEKEAVGPENFSLVLRGCVFATKFVLICHMDVGLPSNAAMVVHGWDCKSRKRNNDRAQQENAGS